MKFNVLIVFCNICFVQVYSGSAVSDDTRVDLEPIIRKDIIGVSDRFVRDILLILDNNLDSEFITETMAEFLLESLARKIKKNEKTSKIDLDGIRKFRSDVLEVSMKNGKIFEESVVIEYIKVVRSILSKQLSPDRYDGITNLLYAVGYSNATTEAIEGALDYLYGTGNTELKDFVADLPTPNATDCPRAYERYSYVNDQLKSMTGIKPEVLGNVAAIIEKFPCNDEFGVPHFLQYFVKIVDHLKHSVSTDRPKISACYIKKEIDTGLNCSLSDENSICRLTSKKEQKLKNLDLILSSRLADEAFRELITFLKATVLNKTPVNEVQKSLEYVFTDVAAIDC